MPPSPWEPAASGLLPAEVSSSHSAAKCKPRTVKRNRKKGQTKPVDKVVCSCSGRKDDEGLADIGAFNRKYDDTMSIDRHQCKDNNDNVKKEGYEKERGPTRGPAWLSGNTLG